MGMLSVKGQIEVAQFWPDGTSDADTAHVIVDGGAAFKYQAQPGGATKATPVFKNATVKGKVSKPALKNNKLIVRFQGIDATELHFRPAPLGKQGTPAQKARYKPFNKEYRPYFRET